MNRLARLVAPCLAFMAATAYGDEATDVRCRIVSQHSDVEVVWVGVFVGPIHPESEAWSWTSDESGEFSVEIPQTEEDVVLVALRRDSVPIVKPITSNLPNSEVTLDFRRGYRVEGKVVSTDGIDVTHAVLTMIPQENSYLKGPIQEKFEWNSANDGTFSIGGLSTGNYEILVALPYVPVETFSVQVLEGDTRRDLELSEAHYVTGRVVDHAEGSVVGAEVTADLNIHFLDFRTTLQTTTDSAGKFLMGPFVYGQNLILNARQAEGGSSSVNRVFSGNHDVLLVLSKMVDVYGTVVDAMTGAPIDEFMLKAFGQGWVREYPHVKSNGKITARVDAESRELVIDAPDYAPFFQTEFAFNSREQIDMGIVELDPGIRVVGLVYDSTSRQPVSGAEIVSFGEGLLGQRITPRNTFIARYMQERIKTTTDAEGRYAIDSLPSGKSILSVYASEYEWEMVQIDAQTVPLDIGLTPLDASTTKIVGRIQTSTGETIAGQVRFHHVESDRGVWIYSENDGSFEYAASAGVHKVYASTRVGWSETIDVDVVEGDIEEIDLVVDSFGRLVGAVSGLKGAEGVFVSVVSGDRTVRRTGRISNGDFSITGLGVGTFTVRARTTMNRLLERTFDLSDEVSEAHVDISFKGNSRLYGKVLSISDRDGFLQIRAQGKEQGSVSAWSDILDDGSFEIRGLTDGEYWLELGRSIFFEIGQSDKESRGRRVEALVSGDTELTIDLASP